MKKSIFITVISLFFATISFSSFAQETNILQWETNFKKVTQLAAKEKKPILLFFHGSDWCPPCKLMQREVFSNPEFITFASKKILFLDVDFPSKIKLSETQLKHNKNIEQKFVIKNGYEQGFPQVIMIDAKGKVLYQKKGYAGEGLNQLKEKIAAITNKN